MVKFGYSEPWKRTYGLYTVILILLDAINNVRGVKLSTRSCQESYLSCIGQPADNITDLGNVTHPVTGELIHLLHSDIGLNWCESVSMCNSFNGELVVIDREDIQLAVANLTHANTGKAWISGIRKKHGNGWTWVTEMLDDCMYAEPAQLDCSKEIPTAEFATMTNQLGSGTQINAVPTINEHGRICDDKSSSPSISPWHTQQQTCIGQTSRLANITDATGYNLKSGVPYFIGLQYNPWVWFKNETDGCDLTPVLYSNWAATNRTPPGSAECLALNPSNGAEWIESSCDSLLNYFICNLDNPEPTETTLPGGGCGPGCIGGIVCGTTVAVVIIAIIVYCFCCKKDADGCCKKSENKTVTNSRGVSNAAGPNNYGDVPDEGIQQVNPYGIADLSKLGGAQTEAAAYRPNSAQYAEVGGVNLQIDPKKAPPNAVTPSQYALARPISEEAKGGPATYGEVKKRDDDDEVIIVDNQNYGAYNPAVDGKIPSGASRGQQLPPIGQDKGQKKPAPATKPPKPKQDKPASQQKNV